MIMPVVEAERTEGDDVAALRARVADLEAAARQGVDRLRALSELTHGLGSVHDAPDACATAVRLLQRLLPGVASLAIYLVDEGAETLELRAFSGQSPWLGEGSTPITLRQETMLSRALLRNRTHVGYGAGCVASPPPDHAGPQDGPCCALTPMRAGAAVVGVLRVTAAPGHAFDAEEISFLEVAAAQVAVEVRALQGRAFLQAVVDQSPASLVVVEAPAGHVVLANRAAHELWGRRLGPAVQDGIACSLVRAPDLRVPALLHTLATGEPVAGAECVVQRADGASTPVWASTASLRDRHGGASYVACTLHDVSAIKALEALKDDFLTVVSHELRTPLTAAKGFLQLGLRRLDHAEPAVIRHTLAEAEVAISALATLVEELLEFSRLQADRFEVFAEPLELRDLLDRQLRAFQGLSARHAVRLNLPEEPVLVQADYHRLQGVMASLVGNAIKYSPRGGAVVITLVPRDTLAVISVADQGMGVPADDKERIFAPYYRARNINRRNLSGLGMGLYISRSVVERHGGRLWLESEEGQGATAFLSLPLLPDRPL